MAASVLTARTACLTDVYIAGLPAEFYCIRSARYFLKEDSLEMATEGFHRGVLSRSQQTGILLDSYTRTVRAT